MTPDELMKPRYMVIADYPCSPVSVGDIYHQTTGDNFQSKADGWSGKIMNRYPHLFKRLEWYEEKRSGRYAGVYTIYQNLYGFHERKCLQNLSRLG